MTETYPVFYAVVFVIVAFFLYKHLFLIEICGDSMYPTLKDGEYYLGVRIYNKRDLDVGKVYIVKRPEEGICVVKRVNDQNYNGNYVWLLGDNLRVSKDSRDYGWVPSNLVIAKLKWRLLK